MAYGFFSNIGATSTGGICWGEMGHLDYYTDDLQSLKSIIYVSSQVVNKQGARRIRRNWAPADFVVVVVVVVFTL